MAKTSGTTLSLILVGWVAFFAILAKRVLGGVTTNVAGGGGSLLASAPFLVTAWHDVAKSEGGAINPLFILAVIWQESGGNPLAKGEAGEIGLMQVLPSTGLLFGASLEAELWNPVINIRVGSRYLQYCFDNTSHVFDALRAYNAGLTGSQRSSENGKAYANAVLNKFNGTRGLDYS